MKLKTFFLTALTAFSLSGFSQTLYVPSGTSGIGSSTNANIGIGISSPIYKLHVNSTVNGWTSMIQNQGCYVYSAYSVGANDGYGMHIRVNNTRSDRYALQVYDGTNNLLYVNNAGNVGMGTTGTGAKLNLKTGWGDWIHFESTSNSGYWAIHNNQSQKDFQIFYRDINGNTIWPFTIKQDGTLQTGSLGINTSNLQGYKLAVNGGVICEEVKVITDVPDADYVFDADYNLKTISELEAFVKEQKHLPNIPSAEEFKKDGYKVGEMDEMLLRKIEEFSLYLIEQNKRIETLEKENQELKNK